MIAIVDNGHIEVVAKEPQIKEGFMMWNGEMREVLEMHETQKGVQIVLSERCKRNGV